METNPVKADEERLSFALAHLKKLLLEQMAEPGVFTCRFPEAGMARRDSSSILEHRFDRPLVSLLVQGKKETVIGGKSCLLEPLDLLTVCVDMPSSSRIIEASPRNPLLTFYFHLNPAIIKEFLLELDDQEKISPPSSGISVTRAKADFVEASLQLATILFGSAYDQLKAQILIKYLHLLLLTGEQGAMIKSLFSVGRKNSNVSDAIGYLRTNLDRIVSTRELARASNMSESSLYRHFKSLIGISPLQYHKQLRLHKARELIMAENEQAAGAAYKVGYESTSQFSRDYKKLFGQPPKRSLK